ncbi:flavin-containing monooxygenase 5-like [Glandiceps talaboti]
MSGTSANGTRVAIIGAGVAGLASIKSCLEENLDPICYERHDKPGGLWNYSNELRPGQGAAIYRSVVTNTSKEMLAFSDFPFAKEYTPFLSHKKILEYLNDYRSNFGLDKYIKFNTTVTDIVKNKGGKYWKVILKNENDSASEEYFDYVMVCIGMYNKPFTPDYPGLDTFHGIKIHASEYRNAEKFRDKKVVVVGGCDTAGEISCEIARSGAEVYLSVRHGTNCVPRIINGQPWDMIVFTRSNFRKSDLRFGEFVEHLCKTRVADYKLFGLHSTESILESKSFMASDDIQDRIVQGQLTPVVDIVGFEENNLKLKNGTILENIDAVIFATGCEYSVPVIDQSWIYGDSDQVNLYKYVFPVQLENPERLAMVGLMSLSAAAWPALEIQSRWASRVFTEKAVLPEKRRMMEDIEQNPRYIGTHYVFVMPYPYEEELAEFIGVKPNFWKLLFSDPKFVYAFEYGPMVPYWYRLQGPGAWSGARDAILNVWENIKYPTRRYRENAGKALFREIGTSQIAIRASPKFTAEYGSTLQLPNSAL